MEKESTAQSNAHRALKSLRTRLLDPTARNRLINFRHTKSASLRVIDELPNQLAEMLLAGKEMRFSAVRDPTKEELIAAGYLKRDEEAGKLLRLRSDPSAEEWAKHLGINTNYEVPATPDENSDKHSDNAIQTLLYSYELGAVLKSLLRKSESAIQEMGANILYMALGFLEWHENSSENSKRIAPLFLVPVRLHKGRLNKATNLYEYTLSYSDEEIISNLSLREKLRADFAMALPELDENTEPEEYFSKVRKLIEDNQPRWRLRRYITLALLNFNKLLMYLDLDPTRWPDEANIVSHPVVARFLSGYDQDDEEDNDSGISLGFGEEYSIDEVKDIHVKYPLIDDADSSQHSALIDAIDGKDLVIEGPPGTGKSQTITNLIAAAMAQGKKVLFVAEKLAALEVVRRRLDRVGLGEFCLELHSHKSQRSRMLDEVDRRLKKNGRYRKPREIEADIARYEELKTELKRYANKINESWRNTGKTSHEVFMAATRYRNAVGINPKDVHPKGYDGNNYDAVTRRRNEEQVDAYIKIYQAVAKQLGNEAQLQAHPWYGVNNTELQVFDLERVSKLLSRWNESLRQLLSRRESIAYLLVCEPSAVAQTTAGMRNLLTDLAHIPALKGDEILDRIPVMRGDLLKESQDYLQLFEDIQARYVSLSNLVPVDILTDLSVIERMLQGSKQLERIVCRDATLHDLAQATSCLLGIENQLKQLEEFLRGVANALGSPGARYLVFSESGLSEFRTVIGIIADLKPSYWKHRDDLFDNDELDEVLPRLRSELEELRELHDRIHEVFVLEDIPGEDEIRRLGMILEFGGVFRWFKKDWREARKRLLGFAAGPKLKLSVMLPLVKDLAAYIGKRQKLEKDASYANSLGKYMCGLDTDIVALEALRKWYRCIRQQYGIGFGEKVALGDAILGLDPNIAKAVRSRVEQGEERKIGGLLDDFRNLKKMFAPVSEFHSIDTELIGSGGMIPRLLNGINQGIEACGSLADDDSLSMKELVDRVEQLRLLKRCVAKWQQADVDNKLFGQRLGLKPGVEVDNSAGLSALRNTLELADYVDKKLRNQALIDYIDQYPTEDTFASLRTQAIQLREAVDAVDSAYSDFSDAVQLDPNDWVLLSSDRLEELLKRNQIALDSGETLQSWLEYVRARERLEELGLCKLVNVVESFTVDISQAKEAYQAGIFDVLAKEILRNEPVLGKFSGRSQEAIQEKFREYDNKLKHLQCELIAWKIDQTKIPAGKIGARVSERTDLALLEHECGKKKRHLPIRQLLHRAGNAMLALKPCFMMGPMSVAQYLAPGKLSFDLVVMDEASQIKPQDALGAIARGGQLVVVGDPKQLPPTSFFDRVVGDEEEDLTGIEESESILDATLSMFPVRRLRWHYRSRHESLIAFSNHSFYDSDLVLFPSPHNETESYGVKYSRVRSGCFVNRRNMEEAKIIAEAVREHFRCQSKETLGVVAMSAEQRLQIEGMIETLAKEDIAFQEWLDKDEVREESLFVKNLENVQGDERDVIFISMTYGPPEPGGKVFQRFGPINSDMGWRRLNVLFTRAKKRMHIFSSMGSSDIIVGSTSRRGVKALRDFLAYCESGILHTIEPETGRKPDSDFEISVMSALRDKGFDCVPQVGVAGFFIDVAVVDPGNPGRYLMGIECDGATYHSAKSVRDRDRLRQAILEKLGWKIRRIWSTDWFNNPEGELRPIIQELNKLKSDVVVALQAESESEAKKIEDIVEEVEAREAQSAPFVFEEGELRDKLVRFDREVIRKELPDTPEDKRLLRPEMVDALVEFAPTSKVEFRETIPLYLRQGTDGAEGKYLDLVFDIINVSLESE